MAMNEQEKALLEELDEYRKEKEQIRRVIGQIGGANSSKMETVLNVIFVILLGLVFTADILRHFFKLQYLSAMFTLEIAVLLVSLKIIWMIHKQTKVEHFQFWILTSIEFRLNSVSKRITQLEKESKARMKDDNKS